MTGFEVNSQDQESRFETDGAHSEDSGREIRQARYWAQVLGRHLPLWLDEEILQNRLSILDWGCGEGEGVDSFRTRFPQSHVAGIDCSAEAIRQARLQFGSTHFARWDVSASLPVTFDILVTSHIHNYETPWQILTRLGAQVARHVVMLVPYAECRPGQGSVTEGTLRGYRFDESTIGTRIEPDFFLSSSQIIRGEYGARILLVYSRPPYLPQAGAVFGEISAAAILLPDPQPAVKEEAPYASTAAPVAGVDPIEAIILPELRRARSIAIVACAIPFSSSLNQRPICCAKYLADRGTTVLFVELWECPEQGIHRTGEEVYPGIFTIPFYAFQSGIRFTFQDNLETIASAAPDVPKSYVCTLPERKLVDAARMLQAAGYHIHYDIMDDWGAFFEGDREMTHWFSAPVEMEMLALADTVTAVSRPLVEKFQRLRGDIAEVRNGYQPSALECAEFAAARSPIQGPLEGPKVVGYFGHFSDAWFDWETLFAAARKRPDLEFELIGYGLSDHSLLRLNAFPNIHYVGLVPQKDLHKHAEKWWAAMIPFQSSTLSAAVDPLKVYEYLHFGLPVVAAGIPSIADFPLVQMVSDGDSFVAALDRLPDRPSEQSLAEVAEFLKSCVWGARFATLDGLLAQHGGPEDRQTRNAVLHADAAYWQAKAVETEKQFERQIRLEETERKQRNGAEQERLRAALQEEQRLREAHQSEREQWRLETAALTREVDERTRLAAGLRNDLDRLQHGQNSREAEVAAHEAVLRSQLQYWQEKAVESGRQLSEERQRHREEVLRFQTAEELAASEIRILQSRVAAGGDEAVHLRRLTSDLLNSWSWKITAPLRFLTKPLFPAPADPMSRAQEPGAGQGPAITASQSPRAAGQESAAWEDELLRAQSIAIIPCAVPFRSAFNQRPISFARHLADRGFTVLYVSWQWSDGKELPPDGEEVYPRIFHLSLTTFQSNLERIASAAPRPREAQPLIPIPPSLYFCSLPSVPLVEAARPLRAGGYHIHYDIMDDWEEFHRLGEASWYSSAIEREMVMLSDTVSAVSAALAAKFARLRGDIAEVRNGYDPDALGGRHFAAARAPLEQPKTIGYFGHLSDAWFDWEALYEAAKKLPDVQWELIGYGLSDRSRARLAGFANIRFSGLVAQSDLHRYAQKWWAGMIPFRPCALSAAVDPLKVYEYLHFGLPVVVTGISGIAKYPLVDFAADRSAFVAAVDRVQGRPDDRSLAKADEFLKASTWGARLDQLLSLTAEPAGLASLYAQ